MGGQCPGHLPGSDSVLSATGPAGSTNGSPHVASGCPRFRCETCPGRAARPVSHQLPAKLIPCPHPLSSPTAVRVPSCPGGTCTSQHLTPQTLLFPRAPRPPTSRVGVHPGTRTVLVHSQEVGTSARPAGTSAPASAPGGSVGTEFSQPPAVHLLTRHTARFASGPATRPLPQPAAHSGRRGRVPHRVQDRGDLLPTAHRSLARRDGRRQLTKHHPRQTPARSAGQTSDHSIASGASRKASSRSSEKMERGRDVTEGGWPRRPRPSGHTARALPGRTWVQLAHSGHRRRRALSKLTQNSAPNAQLLSRPVTSPSARAPRSDPGGENIRLLGGTRGSHCPRPRDKYPLQGDPRGRRTHIRFRTTRGQRQPTAVTASATDAPTSHHGRVM